MKVLVLGHRGMVGSSLIRNSPVGIEIVIAERDRVDISDRKQFESFLEIVRPDAVIVAAAKVGGILANSQSQSAFLVENLNLQNSILMGCANSNINTLIFLGSSCIYPKMARQPINENSLLSGPLEPTNDGYAIAKIAGVRLVRAIFEEKGLNYFSLMPTNLYGPNDNFDLKTSHAPAALMRKFHDAKARGEKSVVVWGSGKPFREFMHVDDLANACWHMMTLRVGGHLINVGTGKDLKISSFANLMAKTVGYEGRIEYDSSIPDGTPRKLLDVTKIHSFGWRHSIELDEGLNQTYNWLLNELPKGLVRGY
jgi:GDP-L-fucose synthase